MDGAMSAYKHQLNLLGPEVRLLNDVHCPGYDIHGSSSMQPASSIEACFEQCHGFNLRN